MAAGDSLVQQILGHGIAARLSARLGEGVINGLLTARVGIAAIDVCRPLPFINGTPPRLADVMARAGEASIPVENLKTGRVWTASRFSRPVGILRPFHAGHRVSFGTGTSAIRARMPDLSPAPSRIRSAHWPPG